MNAVSAVIPEDLLWMLLIPVVIISWVVATVFVIIGWQVFWASRKKDP